MATYDPKKVNVIVGGVVITGFADGEMVVGERNTEKRTQVVGAKGEVDIVQSADNTGKITITLKHTSPSNHVLKGLYKSSTQFPVVVVDSNIKGDVGMAGSLCSIENLPNFERGDDISNNEWVLLVDDYEMSFEI